MVRRISQSRLGHAHPSKSNGAIITWTVFEDDDEGIGRSEEDGKSRRWDDQVEQNDNFFGMYCSGRVCMYVLRESE